MNCLVQRLENIPALWKRVYESRYVNPMEWLQLNYHI